MTKRQEAIFMEGFYSGMLLCLKGLHLDIIGDPNKDAYDYIIELQQKYNKSVLDRILRASFKEWTTIDYIYLNKVRRDIIKINQSFAPNANFSKYLSEVIEQIHKEIGLEKSTISVEEIESKYKELE